MAQLKDTIVSGNLRVTDTTLTDTLQVTIIKAPTTSGGTTYGVGTNGQVLKSNGTMTYWADMPTIPTVNNASLTLKGAGTTVTTFTANASTNQSLDIVAGSNVTITPDATNHKITIASSHPTITKSTDTTSTASPGHGGTFTVVDSVTREANGHVTKINTKTVTLPTDSNTDTKVKQSETTTTNYRPIVFGATDSADISTLAATTTDQTYVSTLLYAQPKDGILYASRMYLKAPGSKGQLNLLTSKYNVMLRNDDSNTYFLVTAQNDPTGPWTSARPLTINNSTGVCNINGNAATATNATNVSTTVTNGSTSNVSYGITYVADPNTSESNTVRKTNDFRISLKNGTAGTGGTAELVLGNNKNTSTADNKEGCISLYSSNTSYHTLKVESTTSPVIHTFPATAGTVLNDGTTSFTQSLTSGTKIGTIKINGTSTDLYCETNTNTDTKVKQMPTTSSNTSYRPVLVGMDYGDPGYTATEKTDAVYTVPRVMIKPSTGDLVLYSGGDTDSPSLTFQRGTQSDGTYDWKLYVTGGHLNFNRNNAGTWTNLVQFEKTGKLYVSGTIYSNNTPVSLDGHKHGLLHSDLNQASTDGTTGGWSVIGIDPAVTGYVLKSIRVNSTSPNWLSGDYGAGIAFGGSDTKGVISMKYQSPVITFAGGNHNSSKTEPVWYLKISGTSGSTYNLANFYDSTISRTANTVLAAPDGSDGGATFRKLVANDLPDSYLPTSGGTVSGTLILSKTQDASGTANNSPALIVGGAATSTHLELDANEIMAKTNGTSTAALYINNDGGNVYINNNLAARHTSTPTSGQVVITDGTSGGIKSSGYTIAKSVPSDAKFTDTTYSAGTGLSLSGTTFNHSNSVTAVANYNKPYMKYDAQGHITGSSYWTATAVGTGGEGGWIKVATMVHTDIHDDTPIMLLISQRGNTITYKLHIVWKNTSNTDPDINKFKLSSDIDTNADAYIKKSTTSTWELYIKKLDNWDAIAMHLYVGKYFPDHMTWTWQDVQTAESAITGGIKAEKIVLYGHLDRAFIYDDKAVPSGHTWAEYAWHKFAEVTITDTWADCVITFLVSRTYGDSAENAGILSAKLRTNGSKAYDSAQLKWLVRNSGLSKDDFVMVYTSTSGTNTKAELWCRIPTQYSGLIFTVLKEHRRHYSTDASWTLVKTPDATGSTHGSSSYPTTGITGTIISSDGTITNSTTGNAATATTATYVTGTLTNPTDPIEYSVPFHTYPTTGSKSLLNNDGISYVCREGTADNLGFGVLVLGNGVNSGTAGNKYGIVRMYPQTGKYYGQIRPVTTLTGSRTYQLPNASGNVILGIKDSGFWGLMDGDGSTSNWIRATSHGFIPSAEAKFYQTATSSLGTDTWYFKKSYIQNMTANTLVLGAAKTTDGAAKGQVKFFSGNPNDATGTVTLECINDSTRTGDYTVKLPTWNGTIPVFEKLFEGALQSVSLSYSDINEYDLFLITVANSNATSEQVTVTSLWVSNIAGVHDMPLIWGGAPTSSGGACNVTSGWIQLSKSSGTITFNIGHKSNVAQMTSSGWSISSPTYNLYIRKIFGLKTYKRT